MVAPAAKRSYRMGARADAVAASGERMRAAAWRHFSRRPYDEVRLSEIAAEADTTVQTLHARFGTKDELFVVAFRWFANQEGTLRDSVPVGDIRAAVHAVHDSYERDGRAVLRLYEVEDRIVAVHDALEGGRRYHRGWVGRVFAPLLDDLPRAARERRHIQLIVATDLLTWKLLRLEMNLDAKAAERIATEMVTTWKGAP